MDKAVNIIHPPMTLVAVVVPFFQRRAGLLAKAVESAFAQTFQELLMVIIADDGSPICAEDEIRPLHHLDQRRILIQRAPNGGVAAARNRALELVPDHIRYVAFLDSDDTWRSDHIENALRALSFGYDVYFSNFIAVGHAGIGHFERVGTLLREENTLLDADSEIYALACSGLEHTVSDGGGLIGTPTVVYDFRKYSKLRFRQQFQIGEDFFLWMDLSELGARYCYSYKITCDTGVGVNIYQASGWGMEKSLQRLRDELFVWTSVARTYKMAPPMRRANQRTIRHFQSGVGFDMVHRIAHGRGVSFTLLREIVVIAPSTLWVVPVAIIKAVAAKLRRNKAKRVSSH